MSHHTDPTLGQVITATSVESTTLSQTQQNYILWLLALSVALMMTGFGIALPIFARRLQEMGSHSDMLALLKSAFAIGQFIAAPLFGALSDRLGRRPIILLALLSFALSNIGYTFAQNTTQLLILRTLAGAMTAGLFPAAIGVISDMISEEKRSRWIGILMGSYGAGLVLGPVCGGIIYDLSGASAPFLLSAMLGLLSLMVAWIKLPETLITTTPLKPQSEPKKETTPEAKITLNFAIIILLLIDFMVPLIFAFVEPRMIFYLFDHLGWSTIRFGVVTGVYGLAMMIVQLKWGDLSDRFGRKPILILGLLLNTTLYPALAWFQSFPLMILSAALSGIGLALAMPALTAWFLAYSDEKNQARMIGIKESMASLGSFIGPLLLSVMHPLYSAFNLFLFATIAAILTALLPLILRAKETDKAPDHAEKIDTTAHQIRAAAAQATLRGVVLNATLIRQQQKKNK
ncbi:MFS transporter [Magnetococcales bacterium HHB-1]